jgi:hypothetical protein
MFILTLSGGEQEGAYSVTDPQGNQILYLFEEQDDADRFCMMLEEKDTYPDLEIVEVDDDLMVKTCELHEYQYTIITKNDLVIPPEDD